MAFLLSSPTSHQPSLGPERLEALALALLRAQSLQELDLED